jgi:two-component system response regulator
LERALKTANIGCPSRVVEDGQRAIDYLEGTGRYADRTHFPRPDFILLDLKLPYVMGLDVLKWIRSKSHYNDIRVVVLTSSVQESDMGAALRLGANGYLVKPASPAGLREVFQNKSSPNK